MLCKNCGSFVKHEWTECPDCKSYIHSENLEILLKEYKTHLNNKDFVKAKIILQKCVEITKFSSKHDTFVNQLNKLNKIILKQKKSIKSDLPKISKYTKELIKNSSKVSELKKSDIPDENDVPIASIIYILLTVGILLILSVYITKPKVFVPKNFYNKLFKIQKTFNSQPKKINLLDSEFNKDFKLKIINNSVNINNQSITQDKIIKADNQIISTSNNNNAVIELDKTVVIIEPNTKIQIKNFKKLQSKNVTELNIIKGSAFFNVNKIKSDDEFKVITPVASAGIRGTKFYINQNNNFKIYCTEGKIFVKHNFNNQEIQINEGKMINLSKQTKTLISKNIPENMIYKLDNLSAASIDILYKNFNKNNYNFNTDDEPKIKIKKLNKKYKLQPVKHTLNIKKNNNEKQYKLIKPEKKYKVNLSNESDNLSSRFSLDFSKINKKNDTNNVSGGNNKNTVESFVKSKYKNKYDDNYETSFEDDKQKFLDNQDNSGLLKNSNDNFYQQTFKETKDKFSDTELKKSVTKTEKNNSKN